MGTKPGVAAAASIGKEISIRGELTGTEDLYIDGELEGTILLKESRLTVGQNARIRANIIAQDVVVLGSLEGNIQASGRVEIRHTATVKGDIAAARFSIEESAMIKGSVEVNVSGAAVKASAQESLRLAPGTV